ncbi:MAG TPA: hypothetical protein DIC56_03040, partial [Rhizobium sp.]|nr:hypothetical protein [Rhizobium sp.]
LYITDLGQNTGGDDFSRRNANLGGDGKSPRDQALTLLRAPRFDIGPGRHVRWTGQSRVNGVDLMQKAGR